jgi:hypothetical protein
MIKQFRPTMEYKLYLGMNMFSTLHATILQSLGLRICPLYPRWIDKNVMWIKTKEAPMYHQHTHADIINLFNIASDLIIPIAQDSLIWCNLGIPQFDLYANKDNQRGANMEYKGFEQLATDLVNATRSLLHDTLIPPWEKSC